jgi:hypothetical protein
MARAYTISTRALLAALLGITVYLSVTRPITAAEAALWDHLVRPPARVALVAPDAWSGLLYALLAKRAIGLLRLSEFSFRLPALLAEVVWFAVLLRAVPRRRWPILLIAAGAPVALGWFSHDGRAGLALAFASLCWWRPDWAGLWAGLAIAAFPVFALPLALWGAVAATRRGFVVVERAVIPAIATAFILLIVPASHAGEAAPVTLGGREEAAVKIAVDGLRSRGSAPLRIWGTPDALPLVEFYRARYRQRNWSVTDRNPDVFIAP